MTIILFLFMLFLYYFPVFLGNYNYDYYNSINLPSYIPNESIFPIAWAIIYIFNSLFFAIFIRNIRISNKGISILVVWLINYLFNIAYPYLFFKENNLYLSCAAAILIFSTILMIYIDLKKEKIKIRWLLIPYLLWTMFASVLSVNIFLIN